MSTRTTRILIIGLAVLVLVLLGVVGYLTLWPKTVSPSVTATSTPITATSTPATPIPPTEGLHIIEHATYYDIDLQYPASTPLKQSINASVDATAVQAMKQFAEDTITTFKTDGDFTDITPDNAQMRGIDPGEKYSLTDTYHMYSGAGTVTYLFSVVEDTLGAHPNTYYKTFTFDENTGQQLALSDLFLPTADYLDTISSISRKDLVQQEGANADETDFIDPGTTPTVDNFADFAVDGTNLTIFFPPYQVAAYAYGAQMVQIPLSQLSTILKSVYSPQ